MIAHCTEHPGLQICKGHVVGKAANVDLSVMVTVRIAANDKHMFLTVASHVGQPHGLVVEYKVRELSRASRKTRAESPTGQPARGSAVVPRHATRPPAAAITSTKW